MSPPSGISLSDQPHSVPEAVEELRKRTQTHLQDYTDPKLVVTVPEAASIEKAELLPIIEALVDTFGGVCREKMLTSPQMLELIIRNQVLVKTNDRLSGNLLAFTTLLPSHPADVRLTIIMTQPTLTTEGAKQAIALMALPPLRAMQELGYHRLSGLPMLANYQDTFAAFINTWGFWIHDMGRGRWLARIYIKDFLTAVERHLGL